MTNKPTEELCRAELLPCPKCGGTNLEEDWGALHQASSEYQTVTLDCKSGCGLSWSFTYDDKIDGHLTSGGDWDLSVWKRWWNTRTNPPQEVIDINYARKHGVFEAAGFVTHLNYPRDAQYWIFEDKEMGGRWHVIKQAPNPPAAPVGADAAKLRDAIARLKRAIMFMETAWMDVEPIPVELAAREEIRKVIKALKTSAEGE